MKIFLAHASAFDFKKKLYEPLRASALNAQHQIILPEERGVTYNTKEEISACDAFIADVSVPSTGAGIEMGWADAAGKRIIAIHEKGSVSSSVIPYLTETIIEYENSPDLIAKLTATLS